MTTALMFFKEGEFEASPDEDCTVIDEPVLRTTALADLPTTGECTGMEESCEVTEAVILH